MKYIIHAFLQIKWKLYFRKKLLIIWTTLQSQATRNETWIYLWSSVAKGMFLTIPLNHFPFSVSTTISSKTWTKRYTLVSSMTFQLAWLLDHLSLYPIIILPSPLKSFSSFNHFVFPKIAALTVHRGKYLKVFRKIKYNHDKLTRTDSQFSGNTKSRWTSYNTHTHTHTLWAAIYEVQMQRRSKRHMINFIQQFHYIEEEERVRKK